LYTKFDTVGTNHSIPLFFQGIDLALSPNNAVAIRLGPEHDISLMVMEYVNGPMEEDGMIAIFAPPVKYLINFQKIDNLEIACVALAHQHAYSCNNHLNNDDLLLVAQQYRNPGVLPSSPLEVRSGVADIYTFGWCQSSTIPSYQKPTRRLF
jgi:hypothetical protein